MVVGVDLICGSELPLQPGYSELARFDDSADPFFQEK